MVSATDLDRLARTAARCILDAFEDYRRRFARITRRAKRRFEERDWQAAQRDGAERLEVYSRVVDDAERDVRLLLVNAVRERPLWTAMRGAFGAHIAPRLDRELAETFFNSVTRRIYDTVGVDPNIEFLFSDLDLPLPELELSYESHQPRRALSETIAQVLGGCPLNVPFDDLGRDAAAVARSIERQRAAEGVTAPIESIEILNSIFFRGKGAYLVGRIRCGDHIMPIALALLHAAESERDGGAVAVDAVLLTGNEVSVLFSFTRSYFHVDVVQPAAMIAFLKSIMPRKPIAELYTAIGFNKHGKTELFRDLMGHIGLTTERFEVARGDRGMVMIVFDLPSFDVVFKVIRDRFEFPKTVTRQQVIEKYDLVFRHDRAGRLADVQDFEHLSFARDRFAPELLQELMTSAAESVRVDEYTITIRHLYTERRMTPLNLYLREVEPAAAREAILDYGQAVKDLAATNIFPGDMLLKNFGVTRHGRVIFYDYDELCLLTDCSFRDLPAARDYDDEVSGEPWFYVAPNDIFPEEFLKFLGLSDFLRGIFLAHHGSLLTADWWRKLQERIRAGEVMDILPYRPQRRLMHA